ncbi:hypothetical protein T439DRAFT_374614 [Meredithblackwellia eburnea MCA 4105]
MAAAPHHQQSSVAQDSTANHEDGQLSFRSDQHSSFLNAAFSLQFGDHQQQARPQLALAPAAPDSSGVRFPQHATDQLYPPPPSGQILTQTHASPVGVSPGTWGEYTGKPWGTPESTSSSTSSNASGHQHPTAVRNFTFPPPPPVHLAPTTSQHSTSQLALLQDQSRDSSHSSSGSPKSPHASSIDELQAQLARQAQIEKKKRASSAESSQRHREKRRQIEREKDDRLEWLERRVYQLESELKRVRAEAYSSKPNNSHPQISEYAESIITSLRTENYELRQALRKMQDETASETGASVQSVSPTVSPAPSRLGVPIPPHPVSPHPSFAPTTSFSSSTRHRLAVAPQLLLRPEVPPGVTPNQEPTLEDYEAAVKFQYAPSHFVSPPGSGLP